MALDILILLTAITISVSAFIYYGPVVSLLTVIVFLLVTMMLARVN